MGEHTPGPWVAEGTEVYAGADCEFHAVADCSCNHTCRHADETRANARLIAAAPDLYAAIKNSDDQYWTPAMRAALAKAEGEQR